MTSNSLTENEERDIPSHIFKTIFGLHASVIFKTQICVVSSSFEGSYDPRSYWSIGRTNSHDSQIPVGIAASGSRDW